ncbi:phosphoribosyltransferase-like protein [Cokeromyces recurvatus]|uniref:phosphoribosyltransferase-like protein n=1 Tax=Cokeromyces recurvatus TaxID=90255 RepID=UPI00221F81EB|nr:phosphoribosyltransferase-like protein [Cokeromyces recurvatus]KAI7897941.1 phosphoribosyltransferase-like protein [Cokeromyces recurvatus]
MRNLVVFGGSSHPEFTEKVCSHLGIPPGKTRLSKFSNNETSVEMKESVREQDVYIIQSACGNVNDNFIELLIMINACKIASAKRITAVIPCFPYSRQPDVPFKQSGEPLTFLPPQTPLSEQPPSKPEEDMSSQLLRKLGQAAMDQQEAEKKGKEEKVPYREWRARPGVLIADLLTCAGADHIITMDLHDAQYPGFFDCPVDNLTSLYTAINYIRLNIPDYSNAIIVSPDAGGAKRATAIAEKLCMDFALVHKERPKVHSQKRESILVGDVRGRNCILIDDITDTSYTITKAARLLREKGARKIYALVSHAILSADAVNHIDQSAIDELIVSNSLPQDQHIKNPKIKVFDVTPLFSEAIRRTHFGESLSRLFEA